VVLPADAGVFALDIPTIFNVKDDRPVSQLTTSLGTVTTVMVEAGQFGVDLATPSPTSKVNVTFFSGIAVSSVGGTIDMDLTVIDIQGLPLALHLQILIGEFSNNMTPTATTNSIAVTMATGASTTIDTTSSSTFGVTDPDIALHGDWLIASVVATPTGVTASVSNQTKVTLTAAAGLLPGVYNVTLIVTDRQGAATASLGVTLTLVAPPPPPSDCVLVSLTATPNPVARQGGGGGAKKLSQNVVVTLTYTGTCNGLRLNYDSGDSSGLGTGVGRVFPPGSPTSIQIVSNGTPGGGTEAFTPGSHVLTASTSSEISANTITTTLTVT